MDPGDWNEVIGGRLYSTATATAIASDEYWDGHTWERDGRNTFLYRTPKGNYFVVYMTQWQRERDCLRALEKEAAIELWEALSEHDVTFEEAFPDAPVEEA